MKMIQPLWVDYPKNGLSTRNKNLSSITTLEKFNKYENDMYVAYILHESKE